MFPGLKRASYIMTSFRWSTLLCFALKLGLPGIIVLASTENPSGFKQPYSAKMNLLPRPDYTFTHSLVEERGIFRRGIFSRIKDKFHQLVDKGKKLLVKVLVYFMHKKKLPERCFENLGCFFYNQSMSLSIGGPQDPKELETTFYFFKNTSFFIDELLDENKTTVIPNITYTLENWTSDHLTECLDTDKPLMVVTHGLTGSKRTPWMKPLVKALLDNVNCTVLVVDWKKGADGSYPDAGINTPMAGALIAAFLHKILNATEALSADNITLIGFSMGAQVMGFAGRRFKTLTGKQVARISGLDPAGWLYENTNSTLNKQDAKYVDVIHTNAGSIRNFRIGLNESVGHVDFYPNGGTVQTGCKNASKFPYKDYLEVITCSHYKATYYFIESLQNKTCSFISYGCNSWEDFAHGNCTERVSQDKTGRMGFYSNLYAGKNNQYLYTNKESPYCRGNNTTPPETK